MRYVIEETGAPILMSWTEVRCRPRLQMYDAVNERVLASWRSMAMSACCVYGTRNSAAGMFRLTDPAGGLKAPVLGRTFGNTGPLALSLAFEEFSEIDF